MPNDFLSSDLFLLTLTVGLYCGLAMALMGIVTALLVPLFEKFCY